MNVSPADEKEYREWIGRGLFEQVHQAALSSLPKALKEEHPALMAAELGSVATCYYTRGAVALLDGNQAGWHDIQCGYWAALYGLRFELKAVTLPAWSNGRRFSSRSQMELVLTTGLAKLFQQQSDASWLLSEVGARFELKEALGSRIRDGTTILEAILATGPAPSYESLLQDRRRCCSKRDAWPKRPTEIRPFGLIDIEAVLHFPQEASFQYPSSMRFDPTEEGAVIESVTAFHTWCE